MRTFERIFTLVAIGAMLTTGLPMVKAQVGPERMLVRLPKRVSQVYWLSGGVILATFAIPFDEFALINVATGEIKNLRGGRCPAYSRDRNQLAWVSGPGGVGDVTVLDLRTQEQRKLTDDRTSQCLTWSPDSRRLAVTAASPFRIVVLSTDGGRVEQVITGGQYSVNAAGQTFVQDLAIALPAWHPDGQRLAFPIYSYAVRSVDVICIDTTCVVRLNYDYSQHPINRIDGFDLRNGRRSEVLVLSDLDRTAHQLAYSPDDRLLSFVVGSELRVFDGTATRVIATGHSPNWAQATLSYCT